MHIKIEESEIPININEQGEFISQHTGNALTWIEASFRVYGDKAVEQVQAARHTSRITVVSDNSEEGMWQVKEVSQSYTYGQPHHDFVWEFKEMEVLKIETLKLANLEVKPYLYEEEIKNGCLYVTALVKLMPAEFEDLLAVYFGDTYFLVIRQGINAEPIEMRFGKVIWSKDEDTIKFKIYLVDKKHDDTDLHLGLFQPELSNIKALLANNAEVMFSLLKMLEEKDILDSQEVEKMLDVDANILNVRDLDFFRVEDIDKYPI